MFAQPGGARQPKGPTPVTGADPHPTPTFSRVSTSGTSSRPRPSRNPMLVSEVRMVEEVRDEAPPFEVERVEGAAAPEHRRASRSVLAFSSGARWWSMNADTTRSNDASAYG